MFVGYGGWGGVRSKGVSKTRSQERRGPAIEQEAQWTKSALFFDFHMLVFTC